MCWWWSQTKNYRQKQPPEVFLKISQILQQNTCVGASFWLVASLQDWNVLKKRLQHRCFPAKFAKCLRTYILKNICERLLLQKSFGLSHVKDLSWEKFFGSWRGFRLEVSLWNFVMFRAMVLVTSKWNTIQCPKLENLKTVHLNRSFDIGVLNNTHDCCGWYIWNYISNRLSNIKFFLQNFAEG